MPNMSAAVSAPKRFFAWILIGIGAFLLVFNFGLIPWVFLSLLFKLWPLVLIFVGLKFLFPPASRIRPVLIFFLFTVIIAIVALPVIKQQSYFPLINQLYSRLQLPEFPQPQALFQPQTFQSTISPELYPQQKISSLNLSVAVGAGRLEMEDEQRDYYLQLDNHQRTAWGKPEISHQLNQEQLTIDLKSLSPSALFAPNRYSNLQLSLGQPQLPTKLSVSVGAGAASLSFAETNFEASILEVGAGSLTAAYAAPALPKKPLNVTVGAGSATLQIPKDVGVRLEYNLGLGKITVDGTSLTGKGIFTSDNYQEAGTQLTIKAEVGLGQLTIERQ